MLERLSQIPWTEYEGVPEMLTLTYPRAFPSSGREAQRHFQAFVKRYKRQWGPMVATWKMEFQRRGAPHFHVYVMRPTLCSWVSPEGERLAGWRAFTEWAGWAWSEVVGDEAQRAVHRRAGVSLERKSWLTKLRNAKAISWYFSKHGLKGAKEYQNQVPDGYEHCGRFWGYIGCAPRVVTTEVDLAEFVVLRRLLRDARAAALGRRPRGLQRNLAGTWAMLEDPTGFIERARRWMHPETYVDPSTGERVSWPPGKRRPLDGT